jgi:hypothetical protein
VVTVMQRKRAGFDDLSDGDRDRQGADAIGGLT